MRIHWALCLVPCLAMGAAQAAEKPDKKTTAFFKAVADGNLAGIQEAVKKKVDLNGFDLNDNTALCNSATAGRVDIVDALLKAGAKIDIPNGAGLTPLMLAARSGRADVAQSLIAAGASKEAVDRRGRPLLFHAVRGGNTGFVSLLLTQGANVNATDENNRTPLMLAAEDGQLELVNVLIQSKSDVNARDLKVGQTPLMAAAIGGHDAVVTALLKAGADPALKDNDGRLARELAEANEHPATAELLKPPPPKAAKASAKAGSNAPRAPKPVSKPKSD
jgi:uncharacterized protein